MKRHAVLFDLDGVLIDSENLYTEFWSDVDRRYPTGVEDFALKIKGSTLPVILATYFPDQAVQRQIRQSLEDFEATMPVEIYPGVPEMVDELRRCGFAIAIVTSSNPEKMQRMFARQPLLAAIPDVLITDADVDRSKPDPQGYNIAASRLGCDPADCVVFEDSYAGIEAGRRAGGKTVGVATTNPMCKVAPLVDLAVFRTADVRADELLALAGCCQS